MKSLVVALVCSVLPCVAYAQDAPAAQQPTFRTGVDVISVDVSAVDGQGRPVEDLLAPDFAVRVDGQPRRVVSAQKVKFDTAEVVKSKAPEPFETFFSTNITPPEGRLIVIAVDELNIRPGNVRPLLAVAAKFVDNLGPADRVSFYAYPQPGAFVDFTDDHARIRRAMETVTGNQVPYQGRFNLGLYEAIQVMLKNDERLFTRVVARECRRTAGGATGNAADQCEQDVLSEMSRIVGKVRDDRYASLQGLQQLLTRLRVIDGQKSLVIISEGLVIEDPANLDDTIRLAAAAQASVNVLMMDVMRGSDVTRGVMPPTMTEDRELQMEGLREMASASRGTLYNVYGNGEEIFNRLASELSAYYLLGVEADPRDRDAKPHRIDVEVRRRGVTLRSRRAFVFSSPRNTAPAEKLSDLLFSPFGVPEIPLRVTTYALQAANGSKVRMLIAADVGQTGATPGRYTMGWALIDREGRVAASGSKQQQLANTPGHSDAALNFSTDVTVDPGVYWLRLGAVDEAGRRGSVVREVNAWKLNGEAFAVGDLVVGRAPEVGSTVIAAVEPHVEGDLAAIVELYSTTPSIFDQTKVTFEVADSEESPALVTIQADGVTGSQPASRTMQGLIVARALPPGSYVARARITRDDKQVGLLVRPFVLHPAAAAATPVLTTATVTFAAPAFDRATTLAPALIKELLDAAEKRAPTLKDAIAEARAGRYAAASLEALGGDQSVAAFLKGLDFYSKGQLDQAANQLNIAAGPRREFFPAAFYLGAAFAAAGRDRDAASVWQLGIGNDPRPAVAYSLFADARFRDGQPQSVIDVLEPAWRRSPTDDQVARRLAFAYIMTGRHADAVPLLDACLAKNGDDQDALYAAIVAQYETSSRAGVSLSQADIAKLTRYARAYRGPQQALVEKYLAALRGR